MHGGYRRAQGGPAYGKRRRAQGGPAAADKGAHGGYTAAARQAKGAPRKEHPLKNADHLFRWARERARSVRKPSVS